MKHFIIKLSLITPVILITGCSSEIHKAKEEYVTCLKSNQYEIYRCEYLRLAYEANTSYYKTIVPATTKNDIYIHQKKK